MRFNEFKDSVGARRRSRKFGGHCIPGRKCSEYGGGSIRIFGPIVFLTLQLEDAEGVIVGKIVEDNTFDNPMLFRSDL